MRKIERLVYRSKKEREKRVRKRKHCLETHLNHRREKDGKQKGGDIMNLHSAEVATTSETETTDARMSDEAAKSGGEREIRVQLNQEREYFVREKEVEVHSV